MTFPFESLTAGSRELGMVAGVLIGIGFGFVLERAGFGRATKLAAQFYFRDMTVFKVMFTAIVTAMLGLVGAASLGLVDLRGVSELIASWTYLWPMLIGGFVLGIGFIVSGYCPGTSAVSSASGNVDGMFAFAGVITGTFVYSELQQIAAFERFHNSGERGALFLYDLIKVPPAVIAIAIAVMAIGAFAGAEKVERMVNRRSLDVSPAEPARRSAWLRFAVPAFAGLAFVSLAGMAFAPAPAASKLETSPQIAPAELARHVAAEPWRYRIEGASVTDLADGRTFAIAGGEAAWKKEPLVAALSSGASFAAPVAAKPTGAFAKPKKKGGGCSS